MKLLKFDDIVSIVTSSNKISPFKNHLKYNLVHTLFDLKVNLLL